MTRYLGNTTGQEVLAQYSFVAMVTVYKLLYLNVNNVQRQLLESVEVHVKT